MKAAIIGLGKMGANMARRLIQGGHEIIGYNRTESVTMEMAESLRIHALLSPFIFNKYK